MAGVEGSKTDGAGLGLVALLASALAGCAGQKQTADDAVKQLQEKGMQLKIQTPQEIAVWKAAMQKPVMDAFLKAAPQDGPKIIDLLNKL